MGVLSRCKVSKHIITEFGMMIETMEYAEIISGYYSTSQYVSKYVIPANAKYYSAAKYIYLFLFFLICSYLRYVV